MNVTDSDGQADTGRDRIRSIFRFLKDFNALRNPTERQIGRQPWVMWLRSLPEHPCISVRGRSAPPDTDFLLRVRRADLPTPPPIPELLAGWIPASWKDSAIASIEPQHERTIGTPPLTEAFSADARRVAAFERWTTLRNNWVREARVAKQALDVFNRLYELYGAREREGEAIQLLLGQGLLVWLRGDGEIRHPVIVQRLELHFDALIPAFTVTESEQPAELLRSLLVTDSNAAASAIAAADAELAHADLDLLDSAKIEGPLRRLAAVLDAQGRYSNELPEEATGHPQLCSDAVLYASRRTQGFSTALDYVLEDLNRRPELPAALLRISGIDSSRSSVDGAPTNRRAWEEPVEILFTKEANDEQIQVAERLGRHGNVLVQGPPGTGKTHTIANLIGHLLAQGKKVLVTAHTSKALKVLRDKVVDPLQTLCVSVLDNDTEARKQLEASVDSMVARLTSDDPAELDRRAEAAQTDRERLMAELATLRRALIDARQDEYREVLVGGVGCTPSDAARFIQSTANENDWLPGPVTPEVASPLSDEDVAELYATNGRINEHDERELMRWRPTIGDVPGAQGFGDHVRRWRELQESDRETGRNLWSASIHDSAQEDLVRIEERIRTSVQLLADAPPWKLDAVSAGIAERPDAANEWRELVERIGIVRDREIANRGLLLDRRCSIAEDVRPAECVSYANEIKAYLESGSRLSWLKLQTRPAWRRFIDTNKVNGQTPTTPDDFRALAIYAELAEARNALGIRWTNQVALRGGPTWESFGAKPEEGVAILIGQIESLIGWHRNHFLPLRAELEGAGFSWRSFLDSQDVIPGEHVELRRLVTSVVDSLPPIVAARVNSVDLAGTDRQFQRWQRELFSPDSNVLPATAVLDLRNSLEARSVVDYETSYRRLSDLVALVPVFERRRFLLSQIRPVAAAWALSIEERAGKHGDAEPPGSARESWRWRQFQQELERRGRVSMHDLQFRLKDVKEQLRQVTARLIELRSWSAQIRRVGLAERQALQGWKDIVRKIGKGTGQRAPGLRTEARKTLARAKDAVPVWIMPLSRVAETFDPRTARFDVVIVDESSQCDVLGLLALYLARQAIVVGDHEQVSPLAVGQTISEVEHLIGQHLNDVPNRLLYDGKTSLYDLARQSFGGVTRLLEHFRCMPEIIAFSNALSYERQIRPLRDSTNTRIVPAVIPYRVSGVRGAGKTNQEEARSIVALLAAANEQPEYRGTSFGVVSLLGEEQAILVDRLARERLSPQALTSMRFLCGTAAQFQGDERDVVFASVVDSPDDGPLTRREADLYRQRFNVAASRPQDQLWVVHSLDPRRDLQPGDLRRRLIEHAEAPHALMGEAALTARTESEFERRVLLRLTDAGFRVTPQWPVGPYRIDLVVEGQVARLAVECDGDRYHPLEKIAEDMGRQAVLERRGWRFARIRGSHFFRDPAAAMKPVFETLAALGITPQGLPRAAVPVAPIELLERVKRKADEILREWHVARNPGQ